MKQKIGYSQNLLWCLDTYRECSLVEQSIKDQFEEMLDVVIYEINKTFEESYESLLFAAVCELGGHIGHYNTVHQTDLVYQYVYKGMELATFIIHIKDIIENNEKTGEEETAITAFQAASMTKKGIINMNIFMMNFLTKITGSEQPVSFNRFTCILDAVEKILENDFRNS